MIAQRDLSRTSGTETSGSHLVIWANQLLPHIPLLATCCRTRKANGKNIHLSGAIVLVLTATVACQSNHDYSPQEIESRAAAASAEHPIGARLSRTEAISYATNAVAQLGYKFDPHQEPVAVYYGAVPGLKSTDWAISFQASKDGVASGFFVYVNDANGATEIVGPSKP